MKGNLIDILNIKDNEPNPLQMTELNWLKKNKSRLSIRSIELELGCPWALVKAMSGKQKLPNKWKEPLRALIKDMK